MKAVDKRKNKRKKKKLSRKKLAVIMILGICVLAAAAYGIYRWIVNDQMSEENPEKRILGGGNRRTSGKR